MDFNEQLAKAELAARASGKILEDRFETAIAHEQKEDMTFVTAADRDSEEVIIDILSLKYPDYNILGEESGHSDNKGEYSWVVDPLDGTANFMNAIPIFAVSIALVRGNEMVLGVIYNPITDSMFSAIKGKGAFCNGQEITVSNEVTKNVIVTFGKSSKKEDGAKVNRLFVAYQEYGYRVRHLGSAALELAYLARGGTEGFVNYGTNLWDYAAGALLVLEAGGKITALDGGPWSTENRYFVASNEKIHDTLLKEIARA
jgi:myo-inositol-1(or 4)-monophosphatase